MCSSIHVEDFSLASELSKRYLTSYLISFLLMEIRILTACNREEINFKAVKSETFSQFYFYKKRVNRERG